MKLFFRLSLRCILAVALVTGSVSAWASQAAHGAGSGHSASEAIEAASGSDSGNCHPPQDAADSDIEFGSDDQNCCSDQADCQHESCNCVCPALTLVVPPRLSTAQHLLTQIALSSLPPGSPRNTIDTPLRPPQA